MSRGDGNYDLAYNGGGRVTVAFRRDGYLPLDRTFTTRWNDVTHLDDVILLEPDPIAHWVAFGANGYQLSSGSRISDQDGTRTATVMFPSGTSATAVLPDGTRVPLDGGNVRLTEYTVGLNGPRAMPAELPPRVAYTYCVEAQIDEAVALGADSVEFDRPVSLYFENFLNARVGTSVPVGTYNRGVSRWIAEQDAFVFKLVNNNPVVIDATGDDLADAGLLATVGLDQAEAAQIAQRFLPGQSFVRARVAHFSPVDVNYVLTIDPLPLDVPNNALASAPNDPNPTNCNGSRIECQNQFLGERIPLQGVPTDLYYASDRTAGFSGAYHLDIPVGPLTNSLATGSVTVTVAGQKYPVLARAPQTDLAAPRFVTFDWDGLDLFGRKTQGARSARVDIRYYPPFRYVTGALLSGRTGGAGSGGIAFSTWGTWSSAESVIATMPARLVEQGDTHLVQSYEVDLGTWDVGTDKLGQWQLGIHHHFDPTSQILYLGDGRRAETSAIGPVVHNMWTRPNDGSANIIPMARYTAVLPDGSMYFAIEFGDTIAKMERDGSVRIVAGARSQLGFVDGVGTDARFHYIRGLALDDAGNLYIADAQNRRIRMMSPDLVVTTLYGGGTPPPNQTDPIDGGSAHGYIGSPFGLARRPNDGSLVYYDERSARLWEIRNGTLRALSGVPGTRFREDGKIGQVSVGRIWDLSAAPNGDVYLCDVVLSSTNALMRKLTLDGDIVTLVGGAATLPPAEGALGTSLRVPLESCSAPKLAPNGSVLFQLSNAIIGRLLPDGTVRHAWGHELFAEGTAPPVEGAPARSQSTSLIGVDVAPDGTLFVATERTLSEVSLLDRWNLETANLVPSPDGREVYSFDHHARHIETRDAMTNALIYGFEYTGGLLTKIIDRKGLFTTIERDASGVATAIVALWRAHAALDRRRTGLALRHFPRLRDLCARLRQSSIE